MGLDTSTLPDHILRLMSAEDRKPLGKAGVTREEAEEKAAVKCEKDLHDLFTNWLRLNDLHFIHSRMDRKPTIRAGWPDFTVIRGELVCCIEFKAPGGKLRPEQVKVINELLTTGTPVLITDLFSEAYGFTTRKLLTTRVIGGAE